MAASFTIAARNNGHPAEKQRAATMTAVTAYRTAMRQFARMGALDVWYAHLSDADLVTAIRDYAATSARDERATAGGSKKNKKSSPGRRSDDAKGRKTQVRAAEKNIRKARSRDHLQAWPSSPRWSMASTASSANHPS